MLNPIANSPASRGAIDQASQSLKKSMSRHEFGKKIEMKKMTNDLQSYL
jgi:hypothetical protein